MATSFSQYKNSRQANTQKLVESLKKTSYQNDDIFWKPQVDKESGKGGAVIRFLPVNSEAALPYVSFGEYAFQWESTGMWFIEKSLQTLGIHDPVYELRTRLYATKIETDKAIATKLRPNKRFVANILVVNDPANPDNNGKVMLYRYGNTIQKFIETALQPEADPLTGETPPSMDAFDMFEGANLEIRIAQTKNGWSYDKTTWSKPAPIAKDEAKMEEIFNQTQDVSTFISEDKFKSYDQLNARLALVIGEEYVGSGIKVTTQEVVQQQTKPKSQPASEQRQAPVQREAQAEDDSVPFDADPPKDTSSSNEDDLFEQMMAEMQ